MERALPIARIEESLSIPAPGTDILNFCQQLGGDPVTLNKQSSRVSTIASCDQVLREVTSGILFDRDAAIPITLKKKRHTVRIIHGHRWGYHEVGPVTRSDVMVVGKWPGREEGAVNRNFVGSSGQILVQALEETGCPRAVYQDWYVTNLIRFEPPSRDLSAAPAHWIKDGRFLLDVEMRFLKPKFVLLLGTEAGKAVLDAEPGGFETNRGGFTRKKMTGFDGEEFEVLIATCRHPAAVARAQEQWPEFCDSIAKFVNRVRFGEQPVERGNYVVCRSAAELEKVVDQVMADHAESGLPFQPVAVDCEWQGKWWDVGPSLPDDTDFGGGRVYNPGKGEPLAWLRTLQFSHKPGFGCAVVLRHGGERSADGNDLVGTVCPPEGIPAVIDQLKRLLVSTPDRHVRLVGHNFKADLPWIAADLSRELAAIALKAYTAPPDTDTDTEDGHLKARSGLGGFDTLYASHAVRETAEFQLEIVASRVLGMPRYDIELAKWKEEFCRRIGVKDDDLGGYAEVPDDVLFPYSCGDVDATVRLFWEFSKEGGLLDKDTFGNSSWRPFWISMRKLPAEIEMESNGLLIDVAHANRQAQAYERVQARLYEELIARSGWDDFNPRSIQHVKTFLFGPEFSGKLDDDGNNIDPRPVECRSHPTFRLTPVKTSGKRSMEWERAVRLERDGELSPSTDKETLGVILTRLKNKYPEAEAFVDSVRSYRFVSQVLSGVLKRDPELIINPDDWDDDDNPFSGGFMRFVSRDGRVRTWFRPVETGRVGSRRPNIQALSKRRENDLRRIAGPDYIGPLRSMVIAPPGWVLVEADFTGAELLAMAVASGSERMILDAQRSCLPESNPDYFDIHSQVAVRAFRLDCPPTKSGLDSIGQKHLRDVVKTVVFGAAYGRSAAAIARGIEETGVVVSEEEAELVKQLLFQMYPELEGYYSNASRRPQTHGWIAGPYQRKRRIHLVSGEDRDGTAGRQFQNFPIQNTVADYLSRSLDHLFNYPRYDAKGPRFRLSAQFHDAVMSLVRVDSVEWYEKTVLRDCMTERVNLYACDLDGRRIPGRPVYHMGYECGVYERWGVPMTWSDCDRVGIPRSYGKPPKK